MLDACAHSHLNIEIDGKTRTGHVRLYCRECGALIGEARRSWGHTNTRGTWSCGFDLDKSLALTAASA